MNSALALRAPVPWTGVPPPNGGAIQTGTPHRIQNLRTQDFPSWPPLWARQSPGGHSPKPGGTARVSCPPHTSRPLPLSSLEAPALPPLRGSCPLPTSRVLPFPTGGVPALPPLECPALSLPRGSCPATASSILPPSLPHASASLTGEYAWPVQYLPGIARVWDDP
jgi:hypothetical protein